MDIADETGPSARKFLRHELYSNASEELRHLSVMRSVAQQLGCPLADILAPYEEELARFRAGARITDYLPVFVARRLRERYRNKSI